MAEKKNVSTAYKAKSYGQIYREMQVLVFGKVLTATDANEGSTLLSLLEAVSRLIAEAYLHCKIGYVHYLTSLVERAFGITAKEGRKAKGFVVFSCEKNKPAESTIYISKGTEVSAGDMIYITTKGAYIEKGKEHSSNVPAEAKEAGEKGNVPAGVIKTILSGLHSSVKTVTNPRAFENGTSAETDVELRKRFVHYIRGLQRTNYYGVKEAALKAGAYHVNVVLCTPPQTITTKIRDGNATSGYAETIIQNVNCAVYVCDKHGDCSIDLLEDVRGVLRGDGTAQNSGYTAAGVHLAVTNVTVDRRFEHNALSVKVKSVMPDKDQAKETIRKTIAGFFAGFEVGQSIILSDLIVAIRQHGFITDAIIMHPKPESGSDNPARTDADKLLVVKEDDIKIDFM